MAALVTSQGRRLDGSRRRELLPRDGPRRLDSLVGEFAVAADHEAHLLTDGEECLVLATLDPLAAMAIAEKDAIPSLLAEVSPGDTALCTLLAELAEEHGLRRPMHGGPDEVPAVPHEADILEVRQVPELGHVLHGRVHQELRPAREIPIQCGDEARGAH